MFQRSIATTAFAQAGRSRCAGYTLLSAAAIPRVVGYNPHFRTGHGIHLPQPLLLPTLRFASTLTTSPPPGAPPSPPPNNSSTDPGGSQQPPPPNNPNPNPSPFSRQRLLPVLTTLFFLTTGAYILILPNWHRNPYPQIASILSSDATPLHPERFTPWVLVAREPCADPEKGGSARSAVFTFRPRGGGEKKRGEKGEKGGWDEWWGKGVWSVEVKQPELMVSRRYTPLPPPLPTYSDSTTSDSTKLADAGENGIGAVGKNVEQGEDGGEKEGELRFLIKEENGGEVSRWLFTLPVGAEVGFRGPRWEWLAPREDGGEGKGEGDNGEGDKGMGRKVVFIAGGTGIAPAMQVGMAIIDAEVAGARRNRAPPTTPNPAATATTMTSTTSTTDTDKDTVNKNPKTEYTILWALRTPSDIPIPIIYELGSLSNLAHKHNISLKFIPHFDSLAQFITQADIEAAIIHPPPTPPSLSPLPPSSFSPSSSWTSWLPGISKTPEPPQPVTPTTPATYHDTRDKLIFISGPEGFINYFAGQKSEDGESQGNLGGVVREVVRRGRELERMLLESMIPSKIERKKEGEKEELSEERRARWFVWKL